MKPKLYNQFRIKHIPMDEIHRDELMELIGNIFTIIHQRDGVMRIRTKRRSLGPRTEWNMMIHEVGDSYEISIENDDDWDPYETILNRSEDARFFIAHFMKAIEKRILDRKIALNSEQRARVAREKARMDRATKASQQAESDVADSGDEGRT